MDDQRTDRKRGGGIVPIARLAALMLICAAACDLPRVGNSNIINEERIPRVVLGACCGIIVEMAIRGLTEK